MFKISGDSYAAEIFIIVFFTLAIIYYKAEPYVHDKIIEKKAKEYCIKYEFKELDKCKAIAYRLLEEDVNLK
jgi:hypothetical protein